MVQQISALIVQPAVDASKYTAGANEKVVADKAMAASSREAGAAVVATDGKISASGDVLARLSRQYVEGYASQQRFEQGLRQLSRGLETGKISMEGAERIIIGMNQRLGLSADVAQIAARGQNELAAAVARANAQIARQATDLVAADAANRKFHAANSNAISAGARQAAGFNAGQQIQDIAMMSLIGQSPMTLALQQGPQLATAIQQGGGLATLGAGLAAVFSTTTLLTVGITAATAATIQWFMKGKEGAKTFDEVLKEHRANVDAVAKSYGLAGLNLDKYLTRSSASAEAMARLSRRELGMKVFEEESALSTKFGTMRDVDSSRYDAFGNATGFNPTQKFEIADRFKPFEGAIAPLIEQIQQGKANWDQFDRSIEKTVENAPYLRGLSNEVYRYVLEAQKAVEQTKALDAALLEMRRKSADPRGTIDQRETRRYVGLREEALQQTNAKFDADELVARARTNAERLAAIEAQVRARAKEDGDKDGGLQARVDRALAAERNRQAIEERDSRIERERSQVRSIAAAREELSLIGATTGEAAKLRYQYAEIARLQEEADKRGGFVNPDDIAKIKATAAELGKLADQASKLNLHRDLQFEREQMFRSPDDQDIASRLRAAGRPVDFDSIEAGLIRANQQLARMKEAWEDIFATARDGIDGVVDALFDGGSIGDALKQVGKDFARQMFDLAATNPLKNWLTGSNLNTLQDLGGMFSGASSGKGGGFGGVLGNLLGAQKAVASMQVQAATVIINGGVLGGASGIPGLSNVSRLLSPANSNNPPMSLSGIGSPGDLSAYRNAIASIESAGSGGYSALGPIHKTMGQALGRYQVMEANLPSWSKEALGRSVSRNEFMGSPSIQDSIFDHRFGSYVDKYGASGAASMWFTGRPSAPNARDALGTSGAQYVEKFNSQLESLGGSTSSAVSALNSLGSSGIKVSQSLIDAAGGLSNFGSILSSFMSSSMGGGSGWFQGLMGMFGGVGGALGHMNSISPKATLDILGAGGGFTGLFANGAAFSGGNVIPFAEGGLVSSPTHFPMSGGRTGLMGEAGPEAIMPLRRGADGKLGVAAGGKTQQGGGGMSAANVESIVNAVAKKLSFNVKNVNVLDPSVVGDYLRTEEGERLVMNIQRRNG